MNLGPPLCEVSALPLSHGHGPHADFRQIFNKTAKHQNILPSYPTCVVISFLCELGWSSFGQGHSETMQHARRRSLNCLSCLELRLLHCKLRIIASAFSEELKRCVERSGTQQAFSTSFSVLFSLFCVKGNIINQRETSYVRWNIFLYASVVRRILKRPQSLLASSILYLIP